MKQIIEGAASGVSMHFSVEGTAYIVLIHGVEWSHGVEQWSGVGIFGAVFFGVRLQVI